MKMRFKSCFFFLVTMYSGKLIAEDKPCDLPHIENGKIAQYYYSFKSYYFPMHKEKKLSYSCMIGYTTESGTQDGRITCTAKGWFPVPRCYKKCSKPLLENGFFYGTETYFKIEEKLQYKCNPGYHTPSGGTEDTVQCQPEGWSSQPSCAKKIESCQVPNLHHGSYFTDRQELRLNETLLYRCDEGYHTAGGNTTEEAVCLTHGWSLPPNCTKITCSSLSAIAHGGFYPVKKIYEEGDVVHFFCEENYSVTVFDLIQCYYFGWYPDPPVCEDVKNKCPPPPLPPHAHIITVKRTYHNGDKARIQCQSTVETEIQCVEGKWSSPPICIGAMDKREPEAPPPLEAQAAVRTSKTYHDEDTKMQQNCTSPPVIKNGVLLGPLLTSYKNGSSVEYSCQRYHFLEGPSTVYCEQGNWTEQPMCLEPCTLNVTDLDSNNIELKWRQEELIFLHGDLVEFECKQGYHFLQTTVLSPGRTQCNHGRLKYPKCILQGTACEDPPVIDFGEIISGNKSRYMERDRVQYMCNAGFTLSGSEWVTCHEKMWVPGPPQCLERPCGSIPKVANAQIEGRNKASYEPGETVSYQCDEGFLIVGTPEIICREGNWTAPPFCEDVTCGTAPEIPNAHITSTQQERYLPGARVQYECESNFQMMDINYVTCTNGQWSRAPTCRDVTCEPPPEIAGGKIEGVKKSRYLPGESARYQCWRGFQMTGSASVTCRTGNWTELPKCKGEGGKCGPPPVIENGDLLSSPMQEYSQGTTLEYKCPSLYLLEGSQYITCTDGQWTSPPVCLVACTSSEEDMSSNNIELKWVRGRKLYSTSGDFVEFKCRRGYVKDPASSPFRVQCVEGMLEYPRCKPGRNCVLDKSTMERNHIQLQSSKLSSMSTYRSGIILSLNANGGIRKFHVLSHFEQSAWME
ncbi:hypothetical protein Q9233_001260 [Columba guinea]|nr:hypothetical protein Q9233_001260 [Columba guinea]